MLSSIALCAVILPLLTIVTGCTSSPEYSGSHSGSVSVSPSSNSSGNGKVAAAWWEPSNRLPLDKISWKDYTHLTYAFA